MGTAYVESITDTIEMVFEDMSPVIGVIFLLSRGDDPTDSIESLCRKKETSSTRADTKSSSYEVFCIECRRILFSIRQF
jgi:hypothetical protein